jgi:hypothetical protein
MSDQPHSLTTYTSSERNRIVDTRGSWLHGSYLKCWIEIFGNKLVESNLDLGISTGRFVIWDIVPISRANSPQSPIVALLSETSCLHIVSNQSISFGWSLYCLRHCVLQSIIFGWTLHCLRHCVLQSIIFGWLLYCLRHCVLQSIILGWSLYCLRHCVSIWRATSPSALAGRFVV